MSTAGEHGRTVLSAVVPDRLDFLEKALRHLTPEHFVDPVCRNLWIMLERYYGVTGQVLRRPALDDLLAQTRADAGKIALHLEMYDLLADARADEADFTWSLTQIRELAADRNTSEALTQAMEILTRGAQDERGNTVRGHADARQHLLGRFAQIDRDLAMQEAPEGDIRTEGDDFLAAYATGEALKAQGRAPGVNFGIPQLDAKLNGIQPGELILGVGYTGDGKSLPLDAPVLTPTGWRPMGDLRIGDRVVDPEDNHPSEVTAVYPQGVLPVYRLTFSDGSTAEASGDHLWDITYWKPVKSGGRQVATKVRETWTTDRISARVLSKSRNPVMVDAPGLARVDFTDAPPLPVDPYALGLLIGDGGLGQQTPYFFNDLSDAELVKELRRALPDVAVVQVRNSGDRTPRYALKARHGRRNPLTEALKLLELLGCRSRQKFVPEVYKWTSAPNRLALLQGIMDTDGGHERGRAMFSSASQQLRDDVVFLARSLGLRATVLKDKIPTYSYRGEKKQGRTAYRCAIWERPELRVFRLARKLQPLRRSQTVRAVVAVDYVRQAECQCIAVSAPSRMFVTRDFLPTHNTHLAVQLAHHAAVVQGRNVVFLTTETVRDTVRRRLVTRHSTLEQFDIPGGINSRDIKNYSLTPGQKDQLQAVVRDLNSNSAYGKLWLAQVPRGATVGDVEARLARVQRMFPVDLLIIDSLYLLHPERRRTTYREELSGILKDAARLGTTFNDGYGVPVFSPWQVSRAARQDAQTSGGYHSSALSETAEASNSAHIIISLLAPMDNAARIATLKMQVMKNRDGEKANPFDVAVDYATSTFGAGPIGATTPMEDVFGTGLLGGF